MIEDESQTFKKKVTSYCTVDFYITMFDMSEMFINNIGMMEMTVSISVYYCMPISLFLIAYLFITLSYFFISTCLLLVICVLLYWWHLLFTV